MPRVALECPIDGMIDVNTLRLDKTVYAAVQDKMASCEGCAFDGHPECKVIHDFGVVCNHDDQSIMWVRRG